MIFEWPEIEKRLRRRARARVARTPKLLRLHRRARKAGRDWNAIFAAVLTVVIGLPAAVFLLIGLPLILAAGVGGGDDPQALLATASMVLFGASYMLGSLLADRLRSSVDLAVLGCLPVADHDVLRVQRRHMLAVSLLVAVPSVAFYAALPFFRGLPPAETAAAVALGPLQWGVTVAGALVMAALVPRWMSLALGLSLWFLPALLVFWALLPAAPWRAPVREFAMATFVLLPTGWLNGALSEGLLRGIPEAAWFALPAALLLAAVPAAAGRLRRLYVVRELSFEEKSLAAAVFDDEAVWRPADRNGRAGSPSRRLAGDGNGEADEESPPLSRQSARRQVLDGEFLAELDWSQAGWVERAAARLLMPRERAIAELLVGGAPPWSQMLRRMAISALVLAALFQVAPLFLRGLLFYGIGWIAMVGLVGAWPAAIWKSASGLTSPAFVWTPVGYREVMRVVMAVACVRALFMLPIACGLGAAGMAAFFGEPAAGLVVGAKICVLYVAMHQWWFLLTAAARTDGRRFLRQLADVPLYVFLGGVFVGAAAVFLAPAAPHVWGTVAAAGLFGSGWLALRHDERALNRDPIDLVGADRKSGKQKSL